MDIIQTIDTASQFRDQFHRYGRGDQFSYEALGLLFDYLSDCGSDVELDVVGICCEFAEDSVSTIIDNYSIDVSSLGDDPAVSELCDYVTEWLSNNTTVVGSPNDCTIVYVQF